MKNAKRNLRIVFAGTPEFALPCFEALIQSSHQIVAVYTQPDRPSGRGRKLRLSAVKNTALLHHLPIYQPVHFKNPEAVATLAQLEPDILIVIAYGLILPQTILSIPQLGCINVHASLLPRWRGASPIQHALLHGDNQSGITIMQMDAGMDTGDCLAQVSCAITEDDTAGSLQHKLAHLAVTPLLNTLDALINGHAQRTLQNSAQATYAGKITKEQAMINWHQSALTIERYIRAYNPWPIAYTHLNEEVIRIHEATVEPVICQAAPGTIMAIEKKGCRVATSDYLLRIQRLQFAGGNIISAADWINQGHTAAFIHSVLR